MLCFLNVLLLTGKHSKQVCSSLINRQEDTVFREGKVCDWSVIKKIVWHISKTCNDFTWTNLSWSYNKNHAKTLYSKRIFLLFYYKHMQKHDINFFHSLFLDKFDFHLKLYKCNQRSMKCCKIRLKNASELRSKPKSHQKNEVNIFIFTWCRFATGRPTTCVTAFKIIFTISILSTILFTAPPMYWSNWWTYAGFFVADYCFEKLK